MIYLGGREIRLIKAKATRLERFLHKIGDLKTKENTAKLVRSAQHFANGIQPQLERYGTTTLWQVVMLVTCVEAYLQDVLTAAASIGPELMNESQQKVPYADVIAANSLEELSNEMRARWARGWLRDGGPTRWISRLGKMGARCYPTDLAPQLELIWGIRHTVVHSGGIATAEFVRRHPGVVKAAGTPLRVGTRDIVRYIDATKVFMTPTEEFFLARYPSLAVEASTESGR
jgi:hypothetical protein